MRLVTLLAISGIVLLVGLAVSYAGTRFATENLETVAGSLEAGNILKVSIELDPRISRDGVYAAKSVGANHYGIILQVTDPAGQIINTHSIVESDSGEAEFVIASMGKYTLEATNTSTDTREIIIAVGYKSEDYALVLVGLGLYVIIAGMAAMAASMIFAIIRSRRQG